MEPLVRIETNRDVSFHAHAHANVTAALDASNLTTNRRQRLYWQGKSPSLKNDLQNLNKKSGSSEPRHDLIQDPNTHQNIPENGGYFPELAYPWSLQYGASSSRGKCTCRCKCGSSERIKIKHKPMTKRIDKPYQLSSWKLHLSSARLKGSASTSQLIAGFALVAMVELNVHDETIVPDWLLVLFTVTTTSLVSVHIFALMISTYILPNLDAITKTHLKGSEILRTPHERFIDVAWTCSTLLGLLLFLVDIAIIIWIQLMDFSFAASLAGTLIVVSAMIAFIAIIIYFHKYANLDGFLSKLQ